MAKKVIFVPGDIPKVARRYSNKIMTVVHEAGQRLSGYCRGSKVFVLRTDTLAPSRTVGVLKSYLDIVGEVKTKSLNYSTGHPDKTDASSFLTLLNEHEGKEDILLVCAPTELINSFIRLWCRWNFIEPCDLRTTDFGVIYLADTEARTIHLI